MRGSAGTSVNANTAIEAASAAAKTRNPMTIIIAQLPVVRAASGSLQRRYRE